MPLYWLGAGLLAYFLATRKARAQDLPDYSRTPAPRDPEPAPPPTPPTYGEPQAYTPFPSGYRRLKSSEVTPELLAAARNVRSSSGFTSLEYGTVIPLDGKNAALVEQHYHQPEGPVKPWGYHHGVTLITRT